MKKKVVVGMCIALATYSFAQQSPKTEALDSVYLDTKIKQPRKNSGKIITTITEEQLAQSGGKSLATVLNEVAGIEINGARSNDGQNLGYFIRGGRNRQVVIMVDGVPINDPSSIANDFDLRLLPANAISQVEIIKGASSVLYGTGAGTGVINITTKKTATDAIRGFFSSTLGTNNSAEQQDNLANAATFTNFAQVSGTKDWFFYNLNFSNRYTDGLSAIAAPDGEERFEPDAFNRFNTRLQLGAQLSKNIKISRFISKDDLTNGFDDFSFTDANNTSISQQIRTGGQFSWKYKKGELVINDTYSSIDREIVSSFPSKFDAELYSADGFASYRVTHQFSAIVGLQFANARFNSFSIPFGETNFAQNVSEETAQYRIIDPYVNVNYVSDFGLQVSAGARLNNHSDYASNLVYQINPSFNWEVIENHNLKFLTSYSTAYIAPSLFQLFDPQFGNAALVPEENQTLEGGVEFTKGTTFRLSAVYFNRNEENFVDFIIVDPVTFESQYRNIEEAFTANGIEVEASLTLKNLTLQANYTNTQAEERFALRIPEHKVNASVGYQITDKSFFSLQYQLNSERTDQFFNPDTFESELVTLESYGLLDGYFSTQLLPTMKVFAQVQNILNEDFEELFRFQTRGRNYSVGFQLTL